MNVDDLRLLNAALTARENWLHPQELQTLHDLRRQVEIGWPLDPSQRDTVRDLVRTARRRSEVRRPSDRDPPRR